MGATWGTLFNWGVSGWGIGRLCAGGLGGWSSRLEEAPSSPNPGHATKPLRGAPQPLISKFITSSGNLSSTEVLLWRLQDNRRLLWLPGTFEVEQRAQVQNCTSRLQFGENTFQLLNTNIKPAYLRLTLKQVGTCSDASFGGPPEKYQTEFGAATIWRAVLFLETVKLAREIVTFKISISLNSEHNDGSTRTTQKLGVWKLFFDVGDSSNKLLCCTLSLACLDSRW